MQHLIRFFGKNKPASIFLIVLFGCVLIGFTISNQNASQFESVGGGLFASVALFGIVKVVSEKLL